MNLFDMIIGGGASVAQGRVNDLDEEERLAQQQALLEARYGGRGGAPGTRTSAPQAAAMDPEATYNFLKQQPSDEDVAAGVRADGGQVIKTLEGGYMRDSEAWRESLERLRRLRTMSAPGGDKLVKAESESRQLDTETGILDRAARGDRDAAAGLLASKGRGEYDGLPGGKGIFSQVRGNQSLNSVGTSEAGENSAKAKKAIAEAEDVPAKRKAGGGTEERLVAAEERRQAADLRAEIKDIEKELEGVKRSDPRRPQLEAELARLRAEQASMRAGRAPAAPAQSPPPAGGAKRLTYDPKTGTFK